MIGPIFGALLNLIGVVAPSIFGTLIPDSPLRQVVPLSQGERSLHDDLGRRSSMEWGCIEWFCICHTGHQYKTLANKVWPSAEELQEFIVRRGSLVFDRILPFWEDYSSLFDIRLTDINIFDAKIFCNTAESVKNAFVA